MTCILVSLIKSNLLLKALIHLTILYQIIQQTFVDMKVNKLEFIILPIYKPSDFGVQKELSPVKETDCNAVQSVNLEVSKVLELGEIAYNAA